MTSSVVVLTMVSARFSLPGSSSLEMCIRDRVRIFFCKTTVREHLRLSAGQPQQITQTNAQQHYNQVAQSFDNMVQPVAAALVLGSDAGVAFSRITEIANYAVDGLDTLAAMPTADVSKRQALMRERLEQA